MPGEKQKLPCGECKDRWLCSNPAMAGHSLSAQGGWPAQHCTAQFCKEWRSPTTAGKAETPQNRAGVIEAQIPHKDASAQPASKEAVSEGAEPQEAIQETEVTVDWDGTGDEPPSWDVPFDTLISPPMPETWKVAGHGNFLFSLIIASREEGANITQTVRSAIEMATGPMEIIVVDDASTDGSCDNIELLTTPTVEVKLIRISRRPLGAGMCRNLGLATALGRVVAVSDAHMVFPLGIFHNMGRLCLSRQCIMCARTQGMGGGSDRAGAQMHLHRDIKAGMEWRRIKEGATDPERRNAVLGGFYMMPREIFDRMGHYPSIVGIWGVEEPALSSWAYFHDVPIYASHEYIVKHLYRKPGGETNDVPWGAPPASDLNLNNCAWMHALFEAETYNTIWRIPNTEGMLTPHVELLRQIEAGNRYEHGQWREGKKHTDYEYFRDCLRVPAVAGEGGSVVGVRTISVIVTARNDGKKIVDTIVSIVNSCQLPHEIVLVDDASEDGSVGPDFVNLIRPRVYAHWRDGLDARLKIIRHQRAIGCTQSRAEAIRAASGEILSVFDGHQAVITPFAIEALAATAADRGGIVIGSVCNLGQAQKPARTYGARFDVKDKWGILNSHVTTRPAEEITRCRAIIGAGYTFTRETMDKLGGFPELPGHWAYCEQWLGLRAYFLDIPLWVDAGLTFEHFYKKLFGYEFPHVDTLMNAHYTFYIHFGDELYEYLKPRLLMHGWSDEIADFLRRPEVQAERAAFAAIKRHTDREFAERELGITEWPPKAIAAT
jgi:glycosyltransferase involved in cell wall biosynthesis